jgi:probable phosphoglycerate mutase
VLEPTRIIAIRHGETDWNRATRIQGQLDIALNATGRWQAHRVGLALADDALHALYASDLWRAYETALAVHRATGLDISVHEGLRERGFGAFEGLTFDEIGQRFPEDAARWRQRDVNFAPPEGGERLQDFFDRSVATVQALAARHPGQTIAVVSHGGVLDALYRAATRMALDATRTWDVSNASINHLLYSPDGGLSLVGWADTFHLEDPALESHSLDDTTA